MKGKLQQTPDGRVIEQAPDPSHTQASPDRRTQVLELFIEACLAVLPEGALAGNARVGFFLYLLGAADRLWQRLDLDPKRFPAFAEELLQRQGVPASTAATLAFALPQVREQGLARETFLEAAETLDDWLDSRDNDRVMGLGELLLRWRRSAPPFDV
jgi:hypothetical protein